MTGKALFWLGVAGLGLIALGMSVEIMLEYWPVTLGIVGLAGLIWLQVKKYRVGKAWVSRSKDGRKVRY